jgi:hypothetical protein
LHIENASNKKRSRDLPPDMKSNTDSSSNELAILRLESNPPRTVFIYISKTRNCVLHRAEAPLSPHPKLLASKRRADAAAADDVAVAVAAAVADNADKTVLAVMPPDAGCGSSFGQHQSARHEIGIHRKHNSKHQNETKTNQNKTKTKPNLRQQPRDTPNNLRKRIASQA